jgi:hypothetical protein
MTSKGNPKWHFYLPVHRQGTTLLEGNKDNKGTKWSTNLTWLDTKQIE